MLWRKGSFFYSSIDSWNRNSNQIWYFFDAQKMTIFEVHNEFEKGLKMGHFSKFFIFITSTAVNLLQQNLPRLSPGEFNNGFLRLQVNLLEVFFNALLESNYFWWSWNGREIYLFLRFLIAGWVRHYHVRSLRLSPGEFINTKKLSKVTLKRWLFYFLDHFFVK